MIQKSVHSITPPESHSGSPRGPVNAFQERMNLVGRRRLSAFIRPSAGHLLRLRVRPRQRVREAGNGPRQFGSVRARDPVELARQRMPDGIR